MNCQLSQQFLRKRSGASVWSNVINRSVKNSFSDFRVIISCNKAPTTSVHLIFLNKRLRFHAEIGDGLKFNLILLVNLYWKTYNIEIWRPLVLSCSITYRRYPLSIKTLKVIFLVFQFKLVKSKLYGKLEEKQTREVFLSLIFQFMWCV